MSLLWTNTTLWEDGLRQPDFPRVVSPVLPVTFDIPQESYNTCSKFHLTLMNLTHHNYMYMSILLCVKYRHHCLNQIINLPSMCSVSRARPILWKGSGYMLHIRKLCYTYGNTNAMLFSNPVVIL